MEGEKRHSGPESLLLPETEEEGQGEWQRGSKRDRIKDPQKTARASWLAIHLPSSPRVIGCKKAGRV